MFYHGPNDPKTICPKRIGFKLKATIYDPRVVRFKVVQKLWNFFRTKFYAKNIVFCVDNDSAKIAAFHRIIFMKKLKKSGKMRIQETT